MSTQLVGSLWNLLRTVPSAWEKWTGMGELAGSSNSVAIVSTGILSIEKGSTKRNLPSDCLEQMLRTSPSPFLQCPICKKVHGIRTGNRPLNGKTEILSWNPSNIMISSKSKIKYLTLVNLAGADMSHQLEKSSLPGHEGFGTIIIRFTFQPGVCPDAT